MVRPKRGIYQLAPDALKWRGKPDELKAWVKQKSKERYKETQALRAERGGMDRPVTEDDTSTPQDTLESAFQAIRDNAYEEIIDTILQKSPQAFEAIVVKLLGAMGYGGQIESSGTVTQASNDGGIDGIIKEDVLGFGRIHIQAKKYARDNTIGRPDIQNFVGALAVSQSSKGVFITTSSFSRGAVEYADSLNGLPTLVLINGQQLAKYIYQYGLGMHTEHILEIKRLDTDFWDGFE